jgi:2-polyprenyl-3-methyl-5-hydroxy-6-metoxy-1,4-benzoquinol methylase
MCELGDQLIDVDGIDFKVAKDYWESLGIKHTSIDINGEHGALPMDLSKPIDVEEIGGPFNIVTNFGTSEHVSDQYECFRNIHNLCRFDGLIIHSVPEVGSWKGHGLFHYSYHFLIKIMLKCDYIYFFSDRIKKPGELKTNIHYSMFKHGGVFPSRKEFDEIGGLHNE